MRKNPGELDFITTGGVSFYMQFELKHLDPMDINGWVFSITNAGVGYIIAMTIDDTEMISDPEKDRLAGEIVSLLSKRCDVVLEPYEEPAPQAIVATAGGIGAELSGGKFVNGAVTAAFAYASANGERILGSRSARFNSDMWNHNQHKWDGTDPSKPSWSARIARGIGAAFRRIPGVGAFITVMSPTAVADGALPQLTQEGYALLGANPVGSALKSDPYHRGATFFRTEAAYFGTHTKILGGDGLTSTLTQLPVSQLSGLNNQAGRVEFMVRGNQLTHQRFIPNGRINGVPNKP